MIQKTSKEFSDKFSVNLSQELQEWFDLSIYKTDLEIDFDESVVLEDLISENSGIVWGGQMLPDSLPILENGCGDAICVRFDERGSIREYILWEHETGLWSPIGKQLSEVLLYYLIFANSNDQFNNFDEQLQSPVIQWAFRTLNFTQDQLSQLRQQFLEKEFFDKFLNLEIAQIPIYEKLTEKCLETALLRVSREIGGGSIAKKIHVDWETFHSWFFEPELIPLNKLKKLSKKLKIAEEKFILQDWSKAFKYAKEVSNIREDIGWPYIVIGRYCEKEGDIENAIGLYYKALKCSKTTYSFTSDWNYCNFQQHYSAQKLLENESNLPESILNDPYYNAVMDANYDSVFKYWKQQALEMEKQEKYYEAYQSWYAAGWDFYITDFMDIVLEGLVRTSQKIGNTALFKLAEYHKGCFNL